MSVSTADATQAFLSNYLVKSYRKGEIIIFQGEAPRAAYIIKRGVIKAYNLSVNGDEKPVGFYTDGEIFPASWVLGKAPSAIYYYEAFSDDVQLYSVPRADYVDFLQSNPRILYAEFERSTTENLAKSMRLNALQHSRAGDKLIYTLHYLALSHGIRHTQHDVEITLALTHQDFANLTGLTRETAATELNKLKHKGVIEYGKSIPYRVRLDKLASMLNDQYISDLEVEV